jgi:hypothetical protein
MIFAISSRAARADSNFNKIKESLQSIIDRYGTFKIRYGVIVFGNTPSVRISLRDSFRQDDLLKRAIDTIPRSSGANFGSALEKAKEMFDNSAQTRPGVKKVLGELSHMGLYGKCFFCFVFILWLFLQLKSIQV